MASTITTRTSIDAALKVIYSGPLHDQVIADSELLSLFESEMNIKTEETTGGRYIEMGHFFALPSGVGARAENEYLPEADDPVFKNSRAYLRKVMGTVEMSGDTMDRVRDDEGAFLDYADRALPALAQRVTNELDRMAIDTGKGIKARVSARSATGSATVTITLGSAMGVSGLTQCWLQFLDGERVVFSANADGSSPKTNANLRAGKVTNIDEVNDQIVVTFPNSTLADLIATNDYIFAGDDAGMSSQTAGAENRELQGLLAAVDDGNIIDTYLNIQRTASGNRLWKSVIVDGSLAPFNGSMSEDLLTYADDQGYVMGMAKVNAIVMSRSANRGYWKSLKGDRFFVDPRGQYQGGKANGGLTVVLGDRTLTLKVARKLPPELAFGLSTDTFKRLSLGSWRWDDTTGSIWNRVTDSTGRKHAFYASGYLYEELITTAPRRNWRIGGLASVQ